MTKCTGIIHRLDSSYPCPLRDHCWRYLMPATEWQSWMDGPDGDEGCKYFVPTEG